MAVDDRTRLNLHRKLESVLGTRGGRHPHGPPASHHMEDIATKDDLRVLGAELRTEFADVPAFPSRDRRFRSVPKRTRVESTRS